jgi:hypothetical protein
MMRSKSGCDLTDVKGTGIRLAREGWINAVFIEKVVRSGDVIRINIDACRRAYSRYKLAQQACSDRL